jgi:hypothetical protein
MRFMAVITVNNPSMSSADWIEHHTKMKKYTDAFTRNEMFVAVNDRQCIISAEMDEVDMSKMDEHVARPESVEIDTRAQITVEAFTCDPMN